MHQDQKNYILHKNQNGTKPQHNLHIITPNNIYNVMNVSYLLVLRKKEPKEYQSLNHYFHHYEECVFLGE